MMKTMFSTAKVCLVVLTIALLAIRPCAVLSDQFLAENTQKVRCIESERQTLLKLKDQVLENLWFGIPWGSSEDQQECCNWEGISCDNQTGHIIALEFQYFHLNGEIGELLSELQHLKHLDLRGTWFHQNQFPTNICSLSNLEYLNLSTASFLGSVPPEVGNLSKLRVLDLSYTFPANAGESLHWLSHLHSLSYLDLSHMDLGNVTDWSETITHLTLLKELHISGSYLSDIPPHLSTSYPIRNSSVNPLSIVDLSRNQLLSSSVFHWLLSYRDSLAYIDLSENILSGPIPKDFEEMRYLRHLDLSYNDFQSYDQVRCLTNMTHLQRLKTSHNGLRGELGVVIEDMSMNRNGELRYVDLSANLLQGTFPNNISGISSLVELYLSSNRIHGSFPKLVGKFSNLLVLDIGGNQLSGTLPDLSIFPSLRELKLSQNNFNLFHQMQNVNFPAIETLDISSNKLGGDVPNLSIFPSLREMHLQDNKFIFFPQITQKLPNLQILDISSNSIVEQIPNMDFLPSLREMNISNNKFKVFPPVTKQLINLQILDVSWNSLMGSIPSPECFPSLRGLYLHENQFNGTIPTSIGLLFELFNLDLHSNILEGIMTEVHFSNLSHLEKLDLSSNPLLTFRINSRWIPPFELRMLGLHGLKLGPYFPTWLRKFFPLYSLDISNTQISDGIPSWFWESSRTLGYLNMSNNQIHGILPPLFFYEFQEPVIDLSTNLFNGTLPPLPPNLTFLDLSNNGFMGSIFGLCNSLGTIYIDLSNNTLKGVLPDCLRNLRDIKVLNLANNYLSGKIPAALGSLKEVVSLHLRNNDILGEIPSFLKNCSKLQVMDFGKNKFSGEVPQWIGESLKSLVILSLQKNQLRGEIPQSLCYLQDIQIIDFSQNKLSGTIPSCLINLTAMTQGGYNRTVNVLNYEYSLNDTSRRQGYDDNAFLQWKGQVLEFRNTLGLVSIIDLSSNNLNGSIPSEISSLEELIGLNLSRNQLVGVIPRNLSKLASLDFLDLSRNKLSGSIPSSLGQLSRLGFLDLSYNNLSGSIPQDNHLQTFSSSAYIGNLELCGLPLLKSCMVDDLTPPKDQRNVNHDQEEEFISKGFYISMGIGFVFGLWGICFLLLVSDPWRYSFLKLVDKVEDWLYIKTVLTTAYLYRIFHNGVA